MVGRMSGRGPAQKGPAGKHHHRTSLVHKKPQQLDQPRSEMNVTPLVDVCLVLLIIFMVIIPMLARGKEVNLPKTKNHSRQKDERQPIVALDRDGVIYFDKEPMGDTIALKNRIEEHWREQGEEGSRRVFFKADSDLTFGQVYPTLMALNELGTPGIDLGTNERKEGESE